MFIVFLKKYIILHNLYKMGFYMFRRMTTLLLVLVLLLILFPMMSNSDIAVESVTEEVQEIQGPSQTRADLDYSWWDAGYAYRIPILVGERSGYDRIWPVSFFLDTERFVHEGKMRSDGGDLRLINQTGVEIPWFNNTPMNTQRTEICFMMNQSANEYSIHYLYFGNPTATYTPDPSVKVRPITPVDQGTVGLWHFNEGDGSMVRDSSPNNINGYLGPNPGSHDMPKWVDGIEGSALSFDADNDYVQCEYNSAYNLTSSFHIEAWVYLKGNGRIVSCRGSDSSGYELDVWDGYARLGRNGAVMLTVKLDGYYNKWTHISVGWDGTYISFYLDGKFKSMNTKPGAIGTSNLPLTFGRMAHLSSSTLDGMIDELCISDFKRSSTDIENRWVNMTVPDPYPLIEPGHYQTLWNDEWKDNEDNVYSEKIPLVISEKANRNLFQYQVEYTFNHSSYVASGKSADTGNDIRVITQDELGNWIEVPRTNESDWNSYETTILFPVDLKASGGRTYYIISGALDAEDPKYKFTDVHSQAESDSSALGVWHLDEQEAPGARGLGTTGAKANREFNGLKFDGDDDMITVADSNSLDFTTQFSISFWMKPYDISSAPRLVSKQGSPNSGYNVILYSNYIRFTLYGTSSYLQMNSNYQLSSTDIGHWKHVACTYDGTTASIYLNGVLDRSLSYSQTITTNSDSLRIGGSGGSQFYFNGTMDEVRMYDRDISATEVAALYAGFSKTDHGLVLYHSFSEGKGTFSEDLSGWANHGLISGVAWTNSGYGDNHYSGWPSPGNWTEGAYDGGYLFDGQDDELFVGNVSQFDKEEISLEAWINPTVIQGPQGRATIFDKGVYNLKLNEVDDGTYNANSLVFYIFAGGTKYTMNSPANSITPGVWQHVAATYQNNVAKLYVDGEEVTITYLNGNPSGYIAESPNLPVRIGQSWARNGEFFGKMDSLRITDGARSSFDILRASQFRKSVYPEPDVTAGPPEYLPSLPSAPQDLVAVVGDEYVGLNWELPAFTGGLEIVNYTLYKGTDPGNLDQEFWLSSDRWYDDQDVDNGITYYYAVSAHNIMGEGPMSMVVNATPLGPPKGDITLSGVAGDGMVSLSWTTPPDLGGLTWVRYNIYGGLLETPIELIGNTTGNTFEHTNLTNGRTYYYRIEPVNDIGIGNLSNIFSAVPMGLPSEPLDLNATWGDSTVELKWVKPLDDGGDQNIIYELFRYDLEYAVIEVRGNLSNTSFIDTDLTNGRTYSYHVTAINQLGRGPQSNTVNVTPYGLPSEPVGFEIESGDGFVNISWRAPLQNGGDPMLSYSIEKGEERSAVSALTSGITRMWYNDTFVNNGTEYFYRVAAVNLVGAGDFTEILNATPMAPEIEPVPNITDDDDDDDDIIVPDDDILPNGTDDDIEPNGTDDDVEPNGTVDDDITDDDDDIQGQSMFFLWFLIPLIVIVIIVIVIIVILKSRKKKEPVEEEIVPEAEKKKIPEKGPKEPEVEEPTIEEPEVEELYSDQAIVAEVGSDDIFMEKVKSSAKEEAMKEVQEYQATKPIDDLPDVEAAPAMAGTTISSWDADVDTGPSKVSLEVDNVDELMAGDFNPYAAVLPSGGSKPMLALPPASVFEADFSEMPTIDEIFLITQSGLLMQHFSYKDTTLVDEDILSSMLVVIQNFIQDSFSSGKSALKEMKLGDFTVLIEQGTDLFVVAISSDDKASDLIPHLEKLTKKIEADNEGKIEDWDGSVDSLVGIEDSVAKMVAGEL